MYKRQRNTNSKSYAAIRAAKVEFERKAKLECDAIALNEAQIERNQREYERLGTELLKLQTTQP